MREFDKGDTVTIEYGMGKIGTGTIISIDYENELYFVKVPNSLGTKGLHYTTGYYACDGINDKHWVTRSHLERLNK